MAAAWRRLAPGAARALAGGGGPAAPLAPRGGRGLTTLPAAANQAAGLAEYAEAFLHGGAGRPGAATLRRTALFFTDAMLCGASALALRTNAPTVLRREALSYRAAVPAGAAGGATVFGSAAAVEPEKAVLANGAAVREWDSNGTNFGFNPALGHTAGEFGHNDYYSVVVAACQQAGRDGAFALRAMVLLDEIRGRLGEVFSLKSYKIDHVLHGAVASAVVYGAILGASPAQIESAVGMTVAHYVPFRAIRAGKQLSDSKGASAAISSEAAVLAVRRSMNGFRGPKDIFRNPEAVYRLFEGPGQMLQKVGAADADLGPAYASPFDLVLHEEGDDFAVMGMHFKLGIYEHQSAGALQAVQDLFAAAPELMGAADGSAIARINIVAYEPAYGIIGDPAKKDPTTRQSADHSMAYIVATLIRRALEGGRLGWKELMLSPYDYGREAIYHPVTRSLMEKIHFEHGGPEYDARYPDGIPTSMVITDAAGETHDSGLVMYPAGHARNTTADLNDILNHKFQLMGGLAFDEPGPLIEKFMNVGSLSAEELRGLNDFAIKENTDFEDLG